MMRIGREKRTVKSAHRSQRDVRGDGVTGLRYQLYCAIPTSVEAAAAVIRSPLLETATLNASR